jgi:DNA modification methylase
VSPLPPLLLRGDCLTELARIPDASVDAVVTDPPYGIDFMGKDWDKAVRLAAGMLGQIASGGKSERGPLPKGGTHSQGYANHDGLAFELWVTKWATECLRILKPGGHLLAFGGSRTWHRLAAGIEDAGFEIRDSIAWLYGSGFPKSMDVSKAIDKALGATGTYGAPKSAAHAGWIDRGAMRGGEGDEGWQRPWMQDAQAVNNAARQYEGGTDEARKWDGWGTALKPAFEPIVVARKPLIGTVAANVLAHGTGALNIDATRVAGARPDTVRGASARRSSMAGGVLNAQGRIEDDGRGRWPANVVLDESQAAALDEQSGVLKSCANPERRGGDTENRTVYGGFTGGRNEQPRRGTDSGGASRFFYVAKAPKSERPVVDGVAHPTVKPLALMRWLLRLVTPPGGCVVDPFAGSGTTLEAAYLEGFESIGVELTPEYWPLIEARIARVVDTPNG